MKNNQNLKEFKVVELEQRLELEDSGWTVRDAECMLGLPCGPFPGDEEAL